MQTAVMEQASAAPVYSQITYEVDVDVAVIMLNRPERLNAWTYPMMGEMFHAVATANADPRVGAIVLSGTGRGFCAGADVKEVFESTTPSETAAPATPRVAGTDWVSVVRSAKPMVAAINGPAYGIGLTLALPCDFIVASSVAKLSCAFIKMGIVPELASSTFLARRCGWGAASDLMLSGRAVDANEALRLRLVDEVTEPDELLAAAKVRARSYGANSETALRFVKELLTQNACETDLAEVQRREGALLAEAFKSPGHREAIAAFTEKRAPKFR
jgi:enoyl-CoA hydratase/carnithine racemase